MADEEFDIPDYVKQFQKDGPIKKNDNFGPGDVVWAGHDGDLDPYQLLDENGLEPETNLENILAALVKGHRPEISDDELSKRIAEAKSAILHQYPPLDAPRLTTMQSSRKWLGPITKRPITWLRVGGPKHCQACDRL